MRVAGRNCLQVAEVCRFEKADMLKYMESAVERGEQFDLVILDPPKLAPTRNSMNRARFHYMKLNALAMQLTTPGGLLMTCSCSGAMTQSGARLAFVRALCAPQFGPTHARRALRCLGRRYLSITAWQL